MPLKAHVAAAMPKINPRMVCQRFCPRYGMPVGRPAFRYRFVGEYIQMPMTMPRMAARVPMPDVQMTTALHCGPCLRSGVKYSQCGMAPTYAPHREPVVVYWTTSPVASERYTCSPVGHEYFQSGLSARETWSVHWSTSSNDSIRAAPTGRPLQADAVRSIIA